MAEPAADQRPYAAIAPKTLITQPPIDNSDPHAAMFGRRDQVGPQFKFHEQQGVGADATQRCPHGPAEVEWGVTDGVLRKPFLGYRETSPRRRGNVQLQVRPHLPQRAAQGRQRIDLSHAHRVGPHAWCRTGAPRDQSEALRREPLTVFAVPPGAVQQPRRCHAQDHEVKHVQQVRHGESIPDLALCSHVRSGQGSTAIW